MEMLKLTNQLAKNGIRHVLAWTDEKKSTFEELKSRLVEGLSLQTAIPDRPYVVRVDASDCAVGAVL